MLAGVDVKFYLPHDSGARTDLQEKLGAAVNARVRSIHRLQPPTLRQPMSFTEDTEGTEGRKKVIGNSDRNKRGLLLHQ